MKENNQEKMEERIIAILDMIDNEYTRAMKEKYNSLIAQKNSLEKYFEEISSPLQRLNKAIAEKGLNAEITYSYDFNLGKTYPDSIIFNKQIEIPLKDKKNDLTDNSISQKKHMNKITMEKLKTMIKLLRLTKEEINLLKEAFDENENPNNIKLEISNLNMQIRNYETWYLVNDYYVDHDTLKKVIYELYEKEIITDDILYAILKKYNVLDNNKNDTCKELLDKLIDFIEKNMNRFTHSVRVPSDSEMKQAEKIKIRKSGLIELPRTRIYL